MSFSKAVYANTGIVMKKLVHEQQNEKRVYKNILMINKSLMIKYCNFLVSSYKQMSEF